MKIQAILFDMDGVLIDAKDWHYEALNQALDIFGMHISRFDHLVTYDGLPTLKKLQMLSRERGLPESLHDFINEMKQIFTNKIIHQKCTPNFTHEYALSRLKAQGYSMAVCSNSIRDTVRLMLDKASILPYFDFFLSNQDVRFGKPDPEIYNTAISKLGLPAKACMVVEDNEKGIEAARQSGANVMIVNSVREVNYSNILQNIRTFEGRAID